MDRFKIIPFLQIRMNGILLIFKADPKEMSNVPPHPENAEPSSADANRIKAIERRV